MKTNHKKKEVSAFGLSQATIAVLKTAGYTVLPILVPSSKEKSRVKD